MNNPSIIRERTRFAGSQGMLTGELAYGEGAPNVAVLLLNPHPHMGGTSDNKLIRRVATELCHNDAVTLRFDYGGVGESEGGEIDVARSMSTFWSTGEAPWDPYIERDACCAARWLIEQTVLPLVVIGYSFGAVAAELVASKLPVAGTVLIAPTVRRFCSGKTTGIVISRLVIYSDNDFATPAHEFEAFITSLRPTASTQCLHGADHFFRGVEGQVASCCRKFVRGISLKKTNAACGEGVQ